MRSPCTSTLSRVVVCGSGPDATSAATALAGTPSARLVSRVAAGRDCGDFAPGRGGWGLLRWDLGGVGVGVRAGQGVLATLDVGHGRLRGGCGRRTAAAAHADAKGVRDLVAGL